MVEETKKADVELDLDDVNETEIQLDDKKNKEEIKAPNLNLGEVDLGYVEHSKKAKDDKVEIEQIEDSKEEKPKVETQPKVEEKESADNLTEMSESIQKRIDKLTRKYREAERREKAALDFAKGLQKKYSESEKKFDTADENYLKEFEARVDAQREQVKNKLKAAIEANDPNQIMEANDELTQLAVQKEKAKLQMADRIVRSKQLEEQRTIQAEEAKIRAETPIIPQPSEKAKEWVKKNTWFVDDRIMANAAITVHEDLVGSGIEVESDEYYNQIDKRMRDIFPHKFVVEEQRKPVQTVASAGRKQQGRRTVRLTKSQVAIAKKLGVPLEEYAKYVKEAN
jgi:hypothetical protein